MNNENISSLNKKHFEEVVKNFVKIISSIFIIVSIGMILNYITIILQKKFIIKDFAFEILKSIGSLFFGFVITKIIKKLSKKNENNSKHDYFSLSITIFTMLISIIITERCIIKRSFELFPDSKYYFFYFGSAYYSFFVMIWIMIKSKRNKIISLIFNQLYLQIRLVFFEEIYLKNVILSIFWIIIVLLIFYQFLNLIEFYGKLNEGNYEQRINQEKEWKNLINILPNGITIINKNDNSLMYLNDTIKNFFNSNLNSDIENFGNLEGKLGRMSVFKNSKKKLENVNLSTILKFIKEKYERKKEKMKNVIDFQLILEAESDLAQIKEIELKILLNFVFADDEAYLLLFEDVTKKNLIKRFRESDEFKTRILSSFCHELRTPLNGTITPLENILIVQKKFFYEYNKKFCREIFYRGSFNKENFDKEKCNEENFDKENFKKENFDKENDLYEDIFEKVDIAFNNTRILSSILDCFVDYSHILTNTLVLKFVKIEIKQIIIEIVETFKYQSKFKKLRIMTKFLDDDLLVGNFYNDKKKIFQILMNIVSNAVKFTFSGIIMIIVKIINEGKEIEICVEDNGIGMDELQLKNLNEYLNNKNKFQTLQINSTGAGLGLLISKNLLKYLGKENTSEFSINSTKNKGSSFSFKIENKGCEKISYPLKRKSFSKLKKSNNSFEEILCIADENKHFIPKVSLLKTSRIINNNLKCNNKFILIVDDEPFNLLALEFILTQFKFSVIKAQNGMEALDIFHKTQCNICEKKECSGFCLIFMDYQMPLLDGVECTKRIKKIIGENKINEIDIIGCSAFDGETEVKMCLEAGMSDFIVKPINLSIIKRILEKFA